MKKLFFLVLLINAILAGPSFADKVTLKDEARIDGNNIMLADIFDGINPADNRKIASAPKPLDSMVLDAGFLSQVAKGYGLDYKIRTGYEKIRVYRNGKIVDASTVASLLKDALADKGVGDDYDVSLLNNEVIAVPSDNELDLEISELAYSDKTSMVVAVLRVRSGGEVFADYKLNARVHQMTEVPVMRGTVGVGKIINEADIAYERVRTDKIRSNIALSADELIGRYAKRTLKAGQMVSVNDLKVPTMVAKGKQVRVIFRKPYMTLTIIGKALDSGTKDEMVRVMNTTSKAIINAVVAGANTVVVSEI